MILNNEQLLLFLELKEQLNWKTIPNLNTLQTVLIELQDNSSDGLDIISSFLEVLETFPYDSIKKELLEV